MKRKMMSMILSGACLLSLIGCGNSSTDSAQASGASSAPKEASSAPQEAEGSTGAVSDAEEKTSEDVKVVIGATGLQEDQFTQVMINGYKDAAAELGIDIITSNSQHSAETETEQINNMLEAGAQGIIIECVNPDSSAAIAETAKEAGAAVFACAITLNSDAVFASGVNDCYDLGKSTGEYAKEYFAEHFSTDETINVGIISYDGQDYTGSNDRITGFLDQLSDYDINLVARQEGEVADKAYTVATDILTKNPDIDVFFCASENGVVGCVNAIEAAGNPNSTVVFGVDCSEQLVDMLKADANILQGTTAQDPYTLGTYAVKTVYEYVVNGVEPAEKDFHAECIALNKSDLDKVDQWLSDWNEHAK